MMIKIKTKMILGLVLYLSVPVSTYFFGTSALAEATKVETATSYSPNLKMVAAYVNSFNSIDDLLNELDKVGIINLDEKTAVADILGKHKISMSTKLVSAKVVGKKVSWGKFFLTLVGSDAFKTKDGVLLHLTKTTSFDQMFSEGLQTVSGSRKTALRAFFIPYAHADAASDFNEWISGMFYSVLYKEIKIISTVFAAKWAVVSNGVAFPLDHLLAVLGNFRHKGSVICSSRKGGRYMYHGGYKTFEWFTAFEKYRAEYDKSEAASALMGRSKIAWAAMKAGIERLQSLDGQERVTDTEIPQEDLKKILPNGVPECSPVTAGKVEDELYAKEAEKIIAEIKTELQPSASAEQPKTKHKVQ